MKRKSGEWEEWRDRKMATFYSNKKVGNIDGKMKNFRMFLQIILGIRRKYITRVGVQLFRHFDFA